MSRSRRFAKRLAPPVLMGFAAASFWIVLKATRPPWSGPAVETAALALLAAGAGVACIRALDYAIFDVLFVRRRQREAPELLRGLVGIIGYSALIAFIYGVVLGRNLGGILATSAVATLILGLALQDMLGNFFAGLSLHVEGPYEIGDSIRLGDVTGRVESVTWRTTALRTNNNSLVVFPNAKIAREPIEIYRLHSENRRLLEFPAPYGAPPEKVIGAVRESLLSMSGMSNSHPPTVRIAAFGASEMVYEVLYWVSDYMTGPEIDARIRERIWYILGRHGWEIPFPVRRLLHDRPSVEQSLSVEERVAILSSIDLFSPLNPAERSELGSSLEPLVFAPQESVVARGDQSASMFIIRRGRAQVLLPEPGSRPRQVATLEPGDFFGEMALFTGEARTADVVALEELEVLELTKTAVERLLRENAGLAGSFSDVIASRQARLAELNREVREKDAPLRGSSILERIQRFFGLA